MPRDASLPLSLEAARDHVNADPLFVPFRDMLRHLPLLKFVYYEKCRFPGSMSESRVVWEEDEAGNLVEKAGHKVNRDMPNDEYSPGVFKPFKIKGIWLPLEEGQLFTILPDLCACPLIKKDEGRYFILFLIHPKSEAIYHDLLHTHGDDVLTFDALSLSSFRSLLVALPNASGTFDPVMVKVSLNEVINCVLRLLSTRECKLSVTNSAILNKKLAERAAQGRDKLPLGFVYDPLSYVPKGCEHIGGMLYRELPSCLNPRLLNSAGIHIMPLLSLYGVRNRELLERLIDRNGETATTFFREHFFNQFSASYVELLHRHSISIEAHGQNLMLVLNADNQILGFLYRDMGGVNQLLTAEECQFLPDNLKNFEEYSYSARHEEDAAKSLEDHFVVHGLYPLTKQLVKSRKLLSDDPQFAGWHQFVKDYQLLQNWTMSHLDDDEHQVDLFSRKHYCRYGYVEALFANCLINYLLDSQILDAATITDMEQHFQFPESLPDGSTVPPCSNITFFTRVVQDVLAKKLALAPGVAAVSAGQDLLRLS